MRILHVLDHSLPLQSGYVFRTMGILRAQRALGWETIQLTTPKQRDSNGLLQDIDGFRFYRTGAPEGILSSWPIGQELSLMTVTGRRLGAVIDETKPDVIHAHSPVLNALPALSIGRKRGIPVIYEVRGFWEDAAVDHGTASAWGLRYRASRALETHALRRAAAATTICEGLRGEIVGRGIPAGKITVIPNSVDLEHFATLPSFDPALAESLGVADSMVVGFIGSFYAYEGLDLLLEALPRLVGTIPNLKVVLVGGGPDRERLEAMARDSGQGDKVVFTGRVAHEDVPRYYGLIDLLIYPRRRQRLTDLVTPLKPLEAMANGRVLVASDVGGHKELIEHERTGFLFRADDLDDLVATVQNVAGRRQSWPEIRLAGRAYIERERTWLTTVKRYEQVYADARRAAA